MKKKLFLSLMFFLGLISCTLEVDVNILPWPVGYYQPYYTNSNGLYAIGGYVNGQDTRAETTSTYGDKFSLFVWTKDSVVMDGYHGVFNGNTWGYTENIKYFDNFVDSYNFIGLIPEGGTYSNGTVTTTALSFTTVDGYDDREVLYATTTVLKADYVTGASLAFNHVNSKIYLKFISDDANTEIIDYYPGHNIYTTTATTVPVLGPAVTAIDISDEDIEYINSFYTATKGFSSYQTNNTISGDLTKDMYAYLLDKYPSLSTINTLNWGTYTSNLNMRLIHISKDESNYRGVFINVLNVNWQEYTVSGISDIVVLPAKVGTTPNRVIDLYVTEATASIDLNGCTLTPTVFDNLIKFTKPSEKIYTLAIASPTVLYALPCNDSEVGFTVKFSFNYKGLNIYDARVWIPVSDVQWQQGKYYIYTINIKGRGNGNPKPNNPEGDDPSIPEVNKYEITVTATIIDYAGDGEYTYDVE